MSDSIQFNQQPFLIEAPMIMGVLNVTPDSFSDGGSYIDPEKAFLRAVQMQSEGASILDIGGESTRPGARPVSVDEELSRVIPVLERLPKDLCLLSIDSFKPEVQEEALKAGAHIINDIMGASEETFALCEKYQAGLVIMHTPASPDVMQEYARYDSVLDEVVAYFEDKMRLCESYNIPRIWIDPGIGFGKLLEHNLDLMKHLDVFCKKCPVLLGTSRKSWIDRLYNVPTDQRLGASLSSIVMGYLKGAEIFRVHDVRESFQALDVARRLK